MSTLDKKDADLFTALCGFGWMIGNVAPLIFDLADEIYSNHGITFAGLTHLDSLGLLRFDSFTGFHLQNIPKKGSVYYYGTPVIIELKDETKNTLPVGNVMLTNAALELAPICGSKKIENFAEYVVTKWGATGVISLSEWPIKPAV